MILWYPAMHSLIDLYGTVGGRGSRDLTEVGWRSAAAVAAVPSGLKVQVGGYVKLHYCCVCPGMCRRRIHAEQPMCSALALRDMLMLCVSECVCGIILMHLYFVISWGSVWGSCVGSDLPASYLYSGAGGSSSVLCSIHKHSGKALCVLSSTPSPRYVQIVS